MLCYNVFFYVSLMLLCYVIYAMSIYLILLAIWLFLTLFYLLVLLYLKLLNYIMFYFVLICIILSNFICILLKKKIHHFLVNIFYMAYWNCMKDAKTNEVDWFILTEWCHVMLCCYIRCYFILCSYVMVWCSHGIFSCYVIIFILLCHTMLCSTVMSCHTLSSC